MQFPCTVVNLYFCYNFYFFKVFLLINLRHWPCWGPAQLANMWRTHPYLQVSLINVELDGHLAMLMNSMAPLSKLRKELRVTWQDFRASLFFPVDPPVTPIR